MSYDDITDLNRKEALKQKEKEIDQRVRQSAELLSLVDQGVDNVSVDPSTGKVNRSNQTLSLEYAKTNPFTERYKQLRSEYSAGTAASMDAIKANGKGFLELTLIAGAIVVTYDSSKEDLDIPRVRGNKSSPRGEHLQARDGNLGMVLVDLNPEKRGDGVDPTTSLVHELRHHNLSVMDFLLGQDPDVRMHTAVRSTTDSDLFGKGFDDSPKSGFISREAFKLDAEQYAALTGREFKPGDEESLQLQLRYLDELHSSYLQKKPDWFMANHNVYSGLAKGKHWEIVGKYPEDQEASKEVLAVTQAVYILETYVLPAVTKKAQEVDAPDYVKDLATEWNNFFHTIGALIGTARTIEQCKRLLQDEWKKFKDKYKELFTKNSAALTQLSDMWNNQGIASPYLTETLV